MAADLCGVSVPGLERNLMKKVRKIKKPKPKPKPGKTGGLKVKKGY